MQDDANGSGGYSADYIESWDAYFAEIAKTVARKSKDPRCQVGCVITLPPDNLIVSTGFNGLPREVLDSPALLADTPEKLIWVCHAEANAILNAARSGVRVRDCSIYVTKFPCFNCCQMIVQSGIAAIYTLDSKYWNDDPDDQDADHRRKRSLLAQAGIKITAPNHPDFGGTTKTPPPGLDVQRIGPKPKSPNGLSLHHAHQRKSV
jgi:dCMP deaminase